MSSKKKVFPKLKKKLSSFLTDESGKISKKQALGLSAGAVLFSGIDEAMGHNNVTHNSSQGNGGHANAGLTPAIDNEGTKTGYGPWLGKTCAHSSGIINGHFSQISTASQDYRLSQTGHGSHGSGGWC